MVSMNRLWLAHRHLQLQTLRTDLTKQINVLFISRFRLATLYQIACKWISWVVRERATINLFMNELHVHVYVYTKTNSHCTAHLTVHVHLQLWIEDTLKCKCTRDISLGQLQLSEFDYITIAGQLAHGMDFQHIQCTMYWILYGTTLANSLTEYICSRKRSG